MSDLLCEGCGKPVRNPYLDKDTPYCAACWEDKQRHDARDALGFQLAIRGPGYNDSRRVKANYRRGKRP